MSILDEVLLLYRTHTKQISFAQREEQARCHKLTQEKLLKELLGDVSADELDLHYKYAPDNSLEAPINEDMEKWFHRLVEANDRAVYISPDKITLHGRLDHPSRRNRSPFTAK